MTISVQFLTMLAMIGMGSFFGAAFDTYNRFLKRAGRKRWIVFCNDILFWLLQALIIFYVLYRINGGELRFYIFLALLCGFAAYQSLLRPGYLRLLEFLIKTVIAVCRFFAKVYLYFIYRPLFALVKMVISIAIMLGNALFALLKGLYRLFSLLVKIVLAPFGWIWRKVWNSFPEKFRKSVTKFYRQCAGILRKIKNIFVSMLFAGKNKGQ